ncbi:Uncharacterised protein [Legionella cincinnatiensis]|uniref:Uncharacterized protein n=1 Tax=Legionella cincinnatiensis TaxID=28085 RepID=A0A378IN81_9GAMM|nr:Uncharacterised protein [Legionella cincinnatiensis]
MPIFTLYQCLQETEANGNHVEVLACHEKLNERIY